MLHSKVIRIIKTLSRSEKQKLGKHLSVYGGSAMNQLWKFLSKFSPEYSNSQLTYENALVFVFGENKRSTSSIVVLMSKLLKVTEAFIDLHCDHLSLIKNKKLKMHDLRSIEFEINKLLGRLQFYDERELNDFFDKTVQLIQEQLDNYPVHNTFYFMHKLMFEKQVAFFNARFRDKRIGDINLQAQSNTIDLLFLVEKLHILIDMMNRQKYMKDKYEYYLLQELIDFVPNSPYINHPLINLLYNILTLLHEKKSVVAFSNTMKKLLLNEVPLDDYTIKSFFTILENCARRNSKSETEYLSNLFKLYDYQIKTQLIIRTNTLHPAEYRNIITVGLRLKEYDWVKRFLQSHEQHLLTEVHEELERIKMVYRLEYFIATKNFEKIKQVVTSSIGSDEIRFKDIHNNTAIRRNLIKGFFELGDFERVERGIIAFKRFVNYHSKEIQEPFNKANHYFIIYLNKIINLDKYYNRQKDMEVDKIKHRLSNLKNVYDKYWLVSKLEEKKKLSSQIKFKIETIKEHLNVYEFANFSRVKGMLFEFKHLSKNPRLSLKLTESTKLFIQQIELLIKYRNQVNLMIKSAEKYEGPERAWMKEFIERLQLQA